ncbi:FUSC family protein [Burkholderia sp. Ac-20365]|uniref:FUSC family protein n=1 Tax=Burkholderia sp. Ac-20365 TaxID=2703897 RepID=UPI00197B8C5E|nr:FUSC family protein [Burkholderia sp. Ac-20365]MBN3760482.1 FUSC family protein [Burkholderia sp. Ac-20365]
MIASYARALAQALAINPELSRLRHATQSTLACLLTAALAIAWLVEHHAAITLASLAALFSMISPLFLRDRRLSSWLISLAALYLCTCICFAISCFVASHPTARGVLLLLIVFTGMLCHSLGPRATGCALLALVSFYLGLYIHPSRDQTVEMLAVSILAPVVVTIVGRVLLPPHAARMPWFAISDAVSRFVASAPARYSQLMRHAASLCKRRLQDELAAISRHRHHLAWRLATLATLAALLALLAGEELSSERSMWAVISTFVVFLGTSSREGTLVRVAKRLAGTLAGAAASVLVVTTLNNDLWVLVALMAMSVFGWAYFILHAYARGVFFITMLVGLVYGRLGFDIVPLAQLRIEEVVVGCLIALVLATLLMPSSAARQEGPVLE